MISLVSLRVLVCVCFVGGCVKLLFHAFFDQSNARKDLLTGGEYRNES